MPVLITNNSSISSQRIVPLWCVGSNGTTPATGEAAGQPQWMIGGAFLGATVNTLSAWSANAGQYYVILAKSETSVIGQGVVRYNSATALEASTPFEIIAVDSFDSVRAGLTALPNAAPLSANGLITAGIGATQLNPTQGNVILAAQTHSGATIQGVTLLNSSVTLNNALYSAVTVRVDPTQVFSGVTVGVNSIAAGSYSGVTVEVSNVGRASMQSQADRFLTRNLGLGSDGGRTVQDALRPLRNNVQIAGSVLTVFTEDDVTSAWTASITTTSNTAIIAGVDPAGP